MQHAQLPIGVRHVYYAYPDREVLKDCTFQVKPGHMTMLVGDNGAGKSTLLRLVLGELKPQQGTIELFGQNPVTFKQWSRVGYVPQAESAMATGFPATAEELVQSGIGKLFRHPSLLPKKLKADRELSNQKVDAALKACGVADLKKSLVSHLSGGQRQRIMLARALVASPELVVLDEPTASLDIHATRAFFALLEQLCHEQHMAALVVTHDLARVNCSHASVLELRDGMCTKDITEGR